VQSEHFAALNEVFEAAPTKLFMNPRMEDVYQLSQHPKLGSVIGLNEELRHLQRSRDFVELVVVQSGSAARVRTVLDSYTRCLLGNLMSGQLWLNAELRGLSGTDNDRASAIQRLASALPTSKC
jgi:hypothetical protein